MNNCTSSLDFYIALSLNLLILYGIYLLIQKYENSNRAEMSGFEEFGFYIYFLLKYTFYFIFISVGLIFFTSYLIGKS